MCPATDPTTIFHVPLFGDQMYAEGPPGPQSNSWLPCPHPSLLAHTHANRTVAHAQRYACRQTMPPGADAPLKALDWFLALRS